MEIQRGKQRWIMGLDGFVGNWMDETFPVKRFDFCWFFLEAFFDVGEVLCSKNLRCTTWGKTVQSQQKTHRERHEMVDVFCLVLRFQNLRVFADIVTP